MSLIYIVRHGEKPLPPQPEGHNLSPTGRMRAAALAHWFLNNFGKPDILIATSLPEKNRTYETIKPLSKLLNLKIKRHFKADQPKAQAQAILENWPDQTILIAWEHHMIPHLAAALGVKNPPVWPDPVFDRLWIIGNAPEGISRNLEIRHQSLLFGDRDTSQPTRDTSYFPSMGER